ncbi:hypothetical protein ANN_13402, partial [Periplaneta americana]
SDRLNLVSFGNYDECVDVVDIHTDMAQSFSGKYCLVPLTWINDTFIFPNELFDDVRVPGSPRTLNLLRGFCIPSTCGAQDLVAGLQEYFDQDVVVTLSNQDCHTKNEKIYTLLDYVTIAVFSAFGIVVALSTAYDIMNKGARRELLLSFSLRRHGPKLLSADSSSDSMSALHGVRTLSSCWIVLGHHYFLVRDVSVPAINTVFINRVSVLNIQMIGTNGGLIEGGNEPPGSLKASKKDLVNVSQRDIAILNFIRNSTLFKRAFNCISYHVFAGRSWENMPLVNFAMAVDTFLLLSGLLVSYVFMKDMRRPDARFNIPLHYLHRYIRLTPVLAALMLIQLSLMDHLGSGPIWGTNVYQTELCRRNWWAALLYIQNYYSSDQTVSRK